MPGPVIPKVTGFWYFIERSVMALTVTFVISSSCFVCPFITAPSVTTASISFFYNKESITIGISNTPGTLQMYFMFSLRSFAFSTATSSILKVISLLNSETTIAMFKFSAPWQIL